MDSELLSEAKAIRHFIPKLEVACSKNGAIARLNQLGFTDKEYEYTYRRNGSRTTSVIQKWKRGINTDTVGRQKRR